VSQAPGFSYQNPRVVRPPLQRAHRNRVFLAGAVSNTVLTMGLTIALLAGTFLAIGAIMAVVHGVERRERPNAYSPLDDILRALGLSPDRAWIVFVVLVAVAILGGAVSWAGIWIGKSMIASAGVARPWAVALSASGILVGVGVLMTSVVSPVAGPMLSVMFGAFALSSASSGGPEAAAVPLLVSILATVVSLVFYAAAGMLVWWWMAYALRRAA
jgi:hypothetical protein